MGRMRQVKGSVPDEVYVKLRDRCAAEDRSESWVVGRALEEFLGVSPRKREKKPKAEVETESVCPHPKERERKLGYMVVCGDCNLRVR